MIIRSQNGNNITTDLNLNIRFMDRWKIENERFFLGTYSTEEKAIKVLKMICDMYANYASGYAINNSIFQMPQDSEV